jgi:hypothetical protein
VYGSYELIMQGLIPEGMLSDLPFELETPDVGLCALSMGGYLLAGYVLSLWISRRRQLS